MLNLAKLKMPMQCTLLIPHLLLPGEIGENACRNLALSALEKFLARSTRLSFEPISMEAWLCQAFEVQKQLDWPVAPLTLTLEGCDPGTAYWLRADPVHLQLQRNKLLLAESGNFTVSRLEADHLVSALNQHFISENLHFIAPNPQRWYLRLQQAPGILTHALSEVSGADVRPYLPSGNDAMHWHNIFNEIQMLLHHHPDNLFREAENALPINSVWLWGGGFKPAVPGRHFSAVWSNNALARALAATAGICDAPVPHDAEQWLQSCELSAPSDAEHLIVLENLESAVRRGDIATWRDEISTLNRNWLDPLLELLGKRITRLTMIVPAIGGCERFELSPCSMRRFWRRNRPVSAYMSSEAKN